MKTQKNGPPNESSSSTPALAADDPQDKQQNQQDNPIPSVTLSDSERVMQRLADGLRQHPELLSQYVSLPDLTIEATNNDAPVLLPIPQEQASEAASSAKVREKKHTLRALIERKIQLMDKLMEMRMEKAWEDCIEKRPWLLQPIEAWVVERYRQRCEGAQVKRREYNSDSEIDNQPKKINERKVRRHFYFFRCLLGGVCRFIVYFFV